MSVPPVPVVPILSPDTPVRGMVSHPHPAALPDGAFALIENLRPDAGVLRVRRPVVELPTQIRGTHGITASGSFRGACVWKDALYAAYAVSGLVRVYRSTNATTWTEVTSAAAKYGNTRLADAGRAVFTPVGEAWTWGRLDDTSVPFVESAPPAMRREMLVVSAGGTPLAITGHTSIETDSPQNTAAVPLAPIAPPLTAAARGFEMSPRSWVNMGSATPTDTGANVVTTTSSAPATWYVRFNFLATATSSDHGQMAVSASGGVKIDRRNFASSGPGLDLSQSRQMLLVATITAADGVEPLDRLVIRVVDAAANVATIWSGGTDYEGVVRIPFDEYYADGAYGAGGATTSVAAEVPALLAFDIPFDAFPSFNWADVRQLRISVSRTDGAELAVELAAWMGGGKWPAQTLFAATHGSAASGHESPGAVLRPLGGTLVRRRGGPEGFVYRIPAAEGLYLVPVLPVQAPAAYAGTDVQAWYAKLPGSDTFAMVEFGPCMISRWGSSWGPNVDGGDSALVGEPVVNLGRILPSEFNAPPPSHLAATSAAGRFAAAVDAGVSLSDAGEPFRHRVIGAAEPGDVGGWTASTEGRPRALAAISGSLLGASSLYAFTADRAYTVDLSGQYPGSTMLAGYAGAAGQAGVAARKGELWFYDPEGQVRRLASGGIGDVSLGVVEDWFGGPRASTAPGAPVRGIPVSRQPHVSAAWHRDRLWLATTQGSGTTNTHLLCYDPRHEGWVLETVGGDFSAEALVPWRDPATGRHRLIAFGHNGRIFDVDVEADASTSLPVTGDLTSPVGSDTRADRAIAVRLATREYHQRHWDPVRLLRIGVCASLPALATIVATRRMRPGPDAANTMALADGVNWAWSDLAGGRGVAGQYDLTMDARWGGVLYSVVAEVEAAGGAGPGVA